MAARTASGKRLPDRSPSQKHRHCGQGRACKAAGQRENRRKPSILTMNMKLNGENPVEVSESPAVNHRLQKAIQWCAVNHAPKPARTGEAYHTKRARSDPRFRAMRRARNELSAIIRGGMKSGRPLDLIGCCPAKLKRHIEAMFEPGMTWQNRGQTWELDHIIPCRMFDFERETDIWECFHFTNLQPLWKWKNRAKGCQVFDLARARKAFL